MLATSVFTSLLPLVAVTNALPSFPEKRATTVPGFDISHYQPNVDFNAAYLSGARFVIIKATESTGNVDPAFNNHWSGATSAHLIRGAYHFAHPDVGTGAQQANWFLAHGGTWTNDGITLPGFVDLEYNPKKGANQCYGLSQAAMVAWVQSFVQSYSAAAGRAPGIYTTADWWRTCTGNSRAFTAAPLWLARHGASVGTIPGGWGSEAIWQNSAKYQYGGDGDLFNGDQTALQRLASPNNTMKAAPEAGQPGRKMRL